MFILAFPIDAIFNKISPLIEVSDKVDFIKDIFLLVILLVLSSLKSHHLSLVTHEEFMNISNA